MPERTPSNGQRRLHNAASDQPVELSTDAAGVHCMVPIEPENPDDVDAAPDQMAELRRHALSHVENENVVKDVRLAVKLMSNDAFWRSGSVRAGHVELV